MPIRLLQAFIAGFVSMMAFHQGLLALLHVLGLSARGAYDMTPARPFGIPSVIALAFYGGLWGIALWLLIRGHSGLAFLGWAVVLGAILPSIGALLGLSKEASANDGAIDAPRIAETLLLNGGWGLGLAWLMRLMAQAR